MSRPEIGDLSAGEAAAPAAPSGLIDVEQAAVHQPQPGHSPAAFDEAQTAALEAAVWILRPQWPVSRLNVPPHPRVLPLDAVLEGLPLVRARDPASLSCASAGPSVGIGLVVAADPVNLGEFACDPGPGVVLRAVLENPQFCDGAPYLVGGTGSLEHVQRLGEGVRSGIDDDPDRPRIRLGEHVQDQLRALARPSRADIGDSVSRLPAPRDRAQVDGIGPPVGMSPQGRQYLLVCIDQLQEQLRLGLALARILALRVQEFPRDRNEPFKLE